MIILHKTLRLALGFVVIANVLASVQAAIINFDLYKVETIKNFEGRPLAMAPDPDGKKLCRYVTGFLNDKLVKIWDIDRREVLQEISFFGRFPLSGYWYPDKSKYCAITSHRAQTCVTEIFDVTTGSSRYKFIDLLTENLTDEEFSSDLNVADSNGGFTAVAFAPHLDRLATCLYQDVINIWHLGSEKCVFQLKGHDKYINSLNFAPTAYHLASASADKTVRVWDYDEGKCLKILKGHSDAVICVAWNPVKHDDDDDAYHLLASGSFDKTVRIWDIKNDKSIEFKHDAGVYTMAWDSDGCMLAVGLGNGIIRIWDTYTGKYRDLSGHEEFIASLMWSEDGKRLVSACRRGVVKIWTFMTEDYEKEKMNIDN